MAKKPTVSDKEMIKWMKILGTNRFLWLYLDDKISLSSKQLDTLIAIKNESEKHENKTD